MLWKSFEVSCKHLPCQKAFTAITVAVTRGNVTLTSLMNQLRWKRRPYLHAEVKFRLNPHHSLHIGFTSPSSWSNLCLWKETEEIALVLIISWGVNHAILVNTNLCFLGLGCSISKQDATRISRLTGAFLLLRIHSDFRWIFVQDSTPSWPKPNVNSKWLLVI